MINERRAAILNLIIEHYLATGEPIGSKTLSQLLPYSVSSATIRNEMAFLSNLGLLEQRHTSGGRVPSDSSYRYYIENLMVSKSVSNFDKQRIYETLSINAGDPERLLADASKLLAEYTHCATCYSMIEDPLDCIQGVDIISAGNNKAMLVLLTVGSKIKSSLINLDSPLDNILRQAFYYVVQKKFISTPLVDVNTALLQSCAIWAGNEIFRLTPILSSLKSLCDEASESKLVVESETNLLSHSEFGTDVYKILSFLAQKKQMEALLKEFANSSKDRMILIGSENPLYELKNATTILSKHKYGNNQTATLGLIGSLRLDYSTIIPISKYIFDTVDKLLTKEVRYE